MPFRDDGVGCDFEFAGEVGLLLGEEDVDVTGPGSRDPEGKEQRSSTT